MKKKLKKIIKKLIIISVVFFIISTASLHFILQNSGLGISVWDIYSQSMPKKDTVKREYENTYNVKTCSYFEKQGKSQCGGFSSAYILRCLGTKINGNENYEQLSHKFSNGYVMPQALLDVFKKYKYKPTLYHGSFEQLKTRLNQGNPIIILIGSGTKWQHYVTVVGYDENNVYLYDSNKNTDNSKGYNRILKNSDFLTQWQNKIPLFENIYFVVTK